jgi:hypothetical protein
MNQFENLKAAAISINHTTAIAMTACCTVAGGIELDPPPTILPRMKKPATRGGG